MVCKYVCEKQISEYSAVFHLVDNTQQPKRGEANYNPAGKFEPLVEHANTLFRKHYLPNEFISVDESMIGTKARSSIRQYLPNKHHARFGIKLWSLCESVTGYCMSLLVYKGKRYDPETTGTSVVMQLLTLCNLLNRAFHVVVDNFFTSLHLAKELFNKGTY